MGTIVSARFNKASEDMGVTQDAFARIPGFSSVISLLEAEKRTPLLDTLARISAHFRRTHPVSFRTRSSPLGPSFWGK